MSETMIPYLLFVLPGVLFGVAFLLWLTRLSKILRQRRVLKYVDPMRAMDLTGRVRQLKVRGREEEAVILVQDEIGMDERTARSWVRCL
ncbi:hypothetical protein [Microtetraspora sp. AC03309]|uniref:hypothetical protein n=1 Tax=Microtetraspora sp. AC03309 TaxID=2779376 RepID=UPI001E43A8DE|nr:hypothetical protein [Microtetraspora sp. AC03309]